MLGMDGGEYCIFQELDHKIKTPGKAVTAKIEEERDMRHNFKYYNINKSFYVEYKARKDSKRKPGFWPGLFRLMVKTSTKIKFWNKVTIGNRNFNFRRTEFGMPMGVHIYELAGKRSENSGEIWG